MNEILRIVTADNEPWDLAVLHDCIEKLGHQLVGAAEDGGRLVQLCEAVKPDLVITDIRMPKQDGIEAAQAIMHCRPTPVILVSGFHDPSLIDRAAENQVFGYLIKPFTINDLRPVIAVTMGRFREMQTLQSRAAQLEQQLEDRKTIEKAKGVLMQRSGLDEGAAHLRLQKMARDKNQSVVEIARALLAAEELFTPKAR